MYVRTGRVTTRRGGPLTSLTTLSTINDANYHKKQVGEVPTFYQEAPPQQPQPLDLWKLGRKYEACMLAFATGEQSSKGCLRWLSSKTAVRTTSPEGQWHEHYDGK